VTWYGVLEAESAAARRLSCDYVLLDTSTCSTRVDITRPLAGFDRYEQVYETCMVPFHTEVIKRVLNATQ
jgi:hypothetical protein